MPRFLIRHFLYPLLAGATVLYLLTELSRPRAELGARHGLFIGAVVIGLMGIEALWPLRPEWRMTGRLFVKRDLPFLALGATTIAACNAAAAWFLLTHALPRPGWLSGLAVLPASVLTLLVTDGLWYAVHRASHEAPGSLGRWLWRMHAAHHLPGQVYVVMHAVGHPINAVIVRLILSVPPWLMGISPEALFVANAVTGVQGLVSHFNVDSRVGWFNRVLVGTELHRWHHGADVRGNYAAVLPLWDQLFGTFVYRPGEDPQRLGVGDPENHPVDTAIVDVLMEPIAPKYGLIGQTRRPAWRADL